MEFANNCYNDSRFVNNSTGAMFSRANLKENTIVRDKPFNPNISVFVNIDIIKHRVHKKR